MLTRRASAILFSLAIIFLSLLSPAQAFGQEATKEQKIRQSSIDLESDDLDKQRKAAFELAIIGKDAIPALINRIAQNRNPEVLGDVGEAICIIGEAAIPELNKVLENETSNRKDVFVLRHTSNALACIAEVSKDDPALKATVQLLIKILDMSRNKHLAAMKIFATNKEIKDKEIEEINESLQDFDAAAHCLGRIGREAKTAIGPLIKIMGDERDRKNGYGKLESINLILLDLIRNSDFSANEEITKSLKEDGGKLQEKDRRKLERVINALNKAQEAQNNILRDIIARYSSLIGIAIFILFILLVWLSIFLLKPIWLLKIYEVFSGSETRMSGVLGAVTIPVQHLLAPLVFRPRVLNAWVKKHLSKARERFSQKTTVKERRVYVPVGLFLNDKFVSKLTPKDLRRTFARNQSRLLISGVGGAGKTSLACQIANWAMREEAEERLRPEHLMLPVLLEHDFVEHGADALKEEIRAQLSDSIDANTPVSNALLQALLEKKRVLVLVDGMSERNEETQTAILSGITKIPTNAVVFTSRNDETIDALNKTVIEPTTIKGNQLSSFVETYLTSLDKKEMFDDEEFFEGCRLLSMIVNDRDITALLAKLFVDLMVAKQEKTIDEDLPKSIPDLMLQSIEVLHKKTPSDELALRDVIKTAKVIAWECLKKNYRPLPADYEEVKRYLGRLPNGERSLNYLKDKLNLIETKSLAFGEKIRFKIDPLAEYLAALYLVEENEHNEKKWRLFFDTSSIKARSSENITGFLLAVRDCCMTEDAKNVVPGFVLEELTKITGIDR